MDETRKTTLLEELATIIVEDIKNNTNTLVTVSVEGTPLIGGSLRAKEAKDIVLSLSKEELIQTIFTTTINSLGIKNIIIDPPKKKNMILRTLLGIIKDYGDPEFPETIVLAINGDEVIKDSANVILNNTPEYILNSPVKCFCSQCLAIEGSCMEIQI